MQLGVSIDKLQASAKGGRVMACGHRGLAGRLLVSIAPATVGGRPRGMTALSLKGCFARRPSIPYARRCRLAALAWALVRQGHMSGAAARLCRHQQQALPGPLQSRRRQLLLRQALPEAAWSPLLRAHSSLRPPQCQQHQQQQLLPPQKLLHLLSRCSSSYSSTFSSVPFHLLLRPYCRSGGCRASLGP